MGKIKKYKNRIERFLSGDGGQRFFNFAYSIGAAIVIWGALFKILHLPGGNMLLSIDMGTEVLMFILTAFDRPPREYNWEEVFPVLDSKNPEDRPDFASGEGVVVAHGAQPAMAAPNVELRSALASGDLNGVSEQYMLQMAAITEQMSRLHATTEALNRVSETLLDSYRAITENSENITQSSTGYVEQMQSLNRNISGLNTIYEIQLKSVSSQLDAIDRVNRGIKDICEMYEGTAGASRRYCEESEKMGQYMAQLNQVYANMLHAMSVNMYAAGVQAAQAAPTAPDSSATQEQV